MLDAHLDKAVRDVDGVLGDELFEGDEEGTLDGYAATDSSGPAGMLADVERDDKAAAAALVAGMLTKRPHCP